MKCRYINPITTLLVLSFCLNLNAQVLWQVKQDKSVVKYYYHSGDEFNSNQFQENIWYNGPPHGRAHMGASVYFAYNNVKFKDGIVSFVLDTNNSYNTVEPWLIDSNFLKKNKIKPVNGKYFFDYSSGMLWSKMKYKYGVFELRFKATDGKGMWPAFWLYGQNNKDEIDFFELKGERKTQIHVDTHCPDKCDKYYDRWYKKVNWAGWVDVGVDLTKGYNTFSVIWKPGQIDWFLNGVQVSKFYGDFQTKMNLILNTSVAVNGGPFSPGPDKTTPYPGNFDVDYVRVFGSSDSLLSNNLSNQLDYVKDTSNIYYPKFVKAKKDVKKGMKKEKSQGFITFYSSGFGNYVVHLNGKFKGINCKVLNESGSELYSSNLKYQFNTINLAKLKRGNYKLIISDSNGLEIKEDFLIK